MDYNTAFIRQLLNETFSDEDLTFFCFDYFRSVYEKFSVNTGRLIKIQLLIEYCETQDEFEKLLALVKQKNPRQYSKFALKVKESSQVQKSDLSPGDTTRLEITLKGDLSEFPPELQYAAVGALAGVLNIPRDYISILTVQAGSIIIQITLPVSAAEALLALYEAKDTIIQDLGIQKVKKIETPSMSIDLTMIGEIEKSILNAQEPERISFDEFTVTFSGDDKLHKIRYHAGHWQCDCDFFQARGTCSHVMTLERLLIGSVSSSKEGFQALESVYKISPLRKRR